MNIKELKELIKDLPDDMPFGLLDLSTDDTDLMNYSVYKSSFDTVDWMEQDGVEPEGKAFVLCFINKMNENPI